ncbi:MAG: hypothetical protein OEQ47_08625 [Acidimicrobiia bacterium]|nr:hypothetical protein [Acidimicrobiia bacterium]
MDTARNIAEIGVGVLFALGAVFNATYTRKEADEFCRSFAEAAWFGPGRRLVERIVVPIAVVFNAAVILLQAAVALATLSRTDLTTAGLVAGAMFEALAALACGLGGTAGNLALAGLQTTLALTG